MQNHILIYVFSNVHYRFLIQFFRLWKPLVFYLYHMKTYETLPPAQPDWFHSMFSILKSISVLHLISYVTMLSLNLIYLIF
jgi:hypothetical protein